MKQIIKDSRIPIYYQLMDIIIDQIASGELAAYDQLPSERELCVLYDVSRATVRQTIQELSKAGYIFKKHGKGTFVSPEKLNQDLLKFYSFTEEMKKLGRTPTSKVIDFQVVSADEDIAEKLRVKKDSKVYKFIRLRLADNEPMMLETTYLPFYRFDGLSRKELEANAMYDIFTKKYNAIFTKAEESFQPVSTKASEARYLNISKGMPSMMIERYTYEKDDIIEYTIGIARGDRFKYRVVLEK